MNWLECLSNALPVAAVCSLLLILCAKAYLNLRRRFPVSVNCWFCNEWSKVHYDFRNSWSCLFCDQYNGFTADGDYNQPIPAQHDEFLNRQLPVSSRRAPPTSNGLCRNCNNNQQLKIHQLASFSPVNDSKFDEEIEIYKAQLERAYRLCPQCEGVVRRALHTQKSTLLGFKLKSSREKGSSVFTPDVSPSAVTKTAKHTALWAPVQYASVLIAAALLADALQRWDPSYLRDALPSTVVQRTAPVQHLGRALLKGGLHAVHSLMATDTFLFVRDYLFGFYPTLQQMDLGFLGTGAWGLAPLTAVGSALQALTLLWRGPRAAECCKSAAWLALALGAGGSPELQIALALFIMLSSCTGDVQRSCAAPAASPVKSKPCAEPAELPVPSSVVDDADLLNCTFQSVSSLGPDPLFGCQPPVRLPSLSVRKLEADLLHTFGQRPAFENPLSTSRRRYSPPAADSSDDSFSSNSPANSCCDCNRGGGSGSPLSDEWELYTGLENLHLGTRPPSRQLGQRAAGLPAWPAGLRPKPILSPPRLRNVTQASWVAGGYWKSSDWLGAGSPSLSRSSSQSSGFGSQASSQPRPFGSLPSSRDNSVCGEPDRFSVLSEPGCRPVAPTPLRAPAPQCLPCLYFSPR